MLFGHIYSVGGEKKSVLVNCNDTNITPIRDVISYDPASNTWCVATAPT